MKCQHQCDELDLAHRQHLARPVGQGLQHAVHDDAIVSYICVEISTNLPFVQHLHLPDQIKVVVEVVLPIVLPFLPFLHCLLLEITQPVPKPTHLRILEQGYV